MAGFCALASRVLLSPRRFSSSWFFRSPSLLANCSADPRVSVVRLEKGFGYRLPVWDWRLVFLWPSNLPVVPPAALLRIPAPLSPIFEISSRPLLISSGSAWLSALRQSSSAPSRFACKTARPRTPPAAAKAAIQFAGESRLLTRPRPGGSWIPSPPAGTSVIRFAAGLVPPLLLGRCARIPASPFVRAGQPGPPLRRRPSAVTTSTCRPRRSSAAAAPLLVVADEHCLLQEGECLRSTTYPDCRRCLLAGLSRGRCPRAGPAGPLRWGRCPAALAAPPPLPLHCWWSSTSTACPKRGSVSVRPRTPTVVAVHPPG